MLKDINILPFWSNVCRDDFGYDRVPAPNAAVEGEFNKIKNIMLKSYRLPLRIDEFIKTHIDYLHGKLKLVHLDKKNVECDKHNNDTKYIT